MPSFSPRVLLRTAAAVIGASVLVTNVAVSQAADEDITINIAIKNHKFEPSDVKVPAGKAVKLIVKNMDDDVEEFESHPLKFEKIIAAGESATIRLQPLSKGTYKFFGEYHEDTAQGQVVAE